MKESNNIGEGLKSLTNEELKRYQRNIILKEWNGTEGQRILKNSSVLVVGAGGTGSPLLYYLAAAGVGRIVICDSDRIDTHNLNRQIIHNENRIGENKALSAQKTLREFNSFLEVEAHKCDLTPDNVYTLADRCDLLFSAADLRDDMKAYRALNKYSFERGTPVLYAGAIHMGGFMTFIRPPETICLDCMLSGFLALNSLIDEGLWIWQDWHPFGYIPRGDNPILGAAAGMIGSLQAMEGIRYLLGITSELWGKVLSLQMREAGLRTEISSIDYPGRDCCKYCESRRTDAAKRENESTREGILNRILERKLI